VARKKERGGNQGKTGEGGRSKQKKTQKHESLYTRGKEKIIRKEKEILKIWVFWFGLGGEMVGRDMY